MQQVQETYNDHVVRLFLVASLIWAIIAMFVGVYLAAELRWPNIDFNIPELTFSRLRPDHTFGIIFAFGVSALMGSSFYIAQRTCHVRLAYEKLAYFVFWGWQVCCVLTMITVPMGITQSKEYAEAEWWIDIMIAVVWISYAFVFFGTLARRRIANIYVSCWYFGAFIIAVALMHTINNLVIPVSLTQSVPIYSGVVDAMVQWWYGHNAVAFILTAGFLGMMYYFVPYQAKQPLWSYRFSIINFWALISVYMWAGAHHLMWTSLPDWTQSAAMAFSIILVMPSWGSSANGLMTFNGVWDKVRNDPVSKFMVISLVFYGASTMEGSIMADKTVNSLSHYTDWTVAHVHSGSIGWVAMITIGSLYAMAPRILGRAMHSVKAIELHFWLHIIGLLLYVVSMWASGVTAGLMWREVNPDGTLAFNFIDSLMAIKPFYILRWLGGCFILSGMVLMTWNIWRTFDLVRAGKVEPTPVPTTAH